MIIAVEKQIFQDLNEHLVTITKKLILKTSISSKGSDSDLFHDHISIKKIKKIYSKKYRTVLNLSQ